MLIRTQVKFVQRNLLIGGTPPNWDAGGIPAGNFPIDRARNARKIFSVNPGAQDFLPKKKTIPAHGIFHIWLPLLGRRSMFFDRKKSASLGSLLYALNTNLKLTFCCTQQLLSPKTLSAHHLRRSARNIFSVQGHPYSKFLAKKSPVNRGEMLITTQVNSIQISALVL